MKGHFEAKKHGYRQTQDGVVISFVMHPSDVTPDLAAAPLGTILMVGYSDEPDSPSGPQPPPDHRPPDSQALGEGADTPRAAPKREAPQRCPTAAPDRLLQYVSIACGDPKFQAWLKGYVGLASVDLDHQRAADVVRKLIGVQSRAEISTNPVARQKALDLMTDYDIHIGKHAKDYTI